MFTGSLMLTRSQSVLLPLDAARICLDCDVLSDSFICPVCARERTAVLSRWLQPVNGSILTEPVVMGTAVSPLPTVARIQLDMNRLRCAIIVPRDQTELYESLRRALRRGARVDVIYDWPAIDPRPGRGGTRRQRRRGDRPEQTPTETLYARSTANRGLGDWDEAGRFSDGGDHG